MYSDTFRIQVQIEAANINDGSKEKKCLYTVNLGATFFKNTIFKWKIEDATVKEGAESWVFKNN
jgi:hypothetical protein